MQGFYYLASSVDQYGKGGENVWERFAGKGIQTAILGMVIVFAVLTIIWGCLEIFKYVFYTLPEQRKKAESEDSASAQTESAPVAQPAYDDKAVVAAIIAAITAAREEEGIPPTVPFRVVSFRKKK